MSVNWFTVAAQIVNFLILVWLLKKFLYKPVLTAMNKRQQKVQDELKEAARLAETAKKEKKQYLALQEEARNRGKEELLKARREADDLRKKLFQEVEAEAEAARVRWQDELSREKALFLKQAGAQVAEQFQLLAQKAFRDLADVDLEENMISRFCALVEKQETEADFFRQLQNSERLQVATVFPLSQSSREAVREVLWLRLGTQPEISFQVETTLLAGILVSSNDHKMEWNIHQYLDDFQNELERFLS
ncbi:MAG: F0F1 ATP synthase subunit delta [Pseudomonadota bacterium]|nr:F0F1 ATP synthase subunit delta [Pseudomonadota bacterium]